MTISQVQNGVNVVVLRVSLSNATGAPTRRRRNNPIFHSDLTGERGGSAVHDHLHGDGRRRLHCAGLRWRSASTTTRRRLVRTTAVTLDDELRWRRMQRRLRRDGRPRQSEPANPATGTLVHSYGADGAGTTLLTGSGSCDGPGRQWLVLPDGCTPGGLSILTISQVQNGVNVVVLTVSLSNATGGAYTVDAEQPRSSTRSHRSERGGISSSRSPTR